MKPNRTKRSLVFLLCLAMILSCTPMQAAARGNTTSARVISQDIAQTDPVSGKNKENTDSITTASDNAAKTAAAVAGSKSSPAADGSEADDPQNGADDQNGNVSQTGKDSGSTGKESGKTISAKQLVEDTGKNSDEDKNDDGSGEENAPDAKDGKTDIDESDDIPIQALASNTVTLYTTNDIHGVVENSDSAIGLAQAAGIAASTENGILVDAGDSTQGASFASITQGADVIRLMNAAGYHAMAAGNHEFDYGAEQLLSNAKLAEFPILSANTMRNGAPMLDQDTIVDVGGHKIGFIGLTTTSTATSSNPGKLENVTFADEVETAKAEIAKLKDSTDAIVLICHMGDNASAAKCTSGQLLDSLSDSERSEIAAVVDGHSHSFENSNHGNTSIPVIQTGTQFTSLGVITLTFGTDSVSASGRLMDYAEAMAYKLNDDGTAAVNKVNSALNEIKASQNAVLSEELCVNSTPLWGGYIYYDYAEPRIVETSYGDFVTDAFAASASTFAKRQNLTAPVIAVENGGGISATLPLGKVTRGDVLNAFNHGNMVEILQITPAQLYAALEAGLVVTGQDAKDGLLLRERVSGSFLQVSGFTYTYDPAGKAGEKVTSVVLDNKTALKRDDTTTALLLASNNYVTSFDAFAGAEKLGELGGEDIIVENYLSEQTSNGKSALSVPTKANRIRIANDQSPATYDVSIPIEDSGNGKTSLAGRVVHLQIDDGNEKSYTLDSSGRLNLTLAKGPHTLYLSESTDAKPVYVNNYSGSGTVTTKDGYYRLAFVVDASELSLPHTHQFSDEWKHNNSRHWRECECGERTDVGEHSYEDGYCTVCGAKDPDYTAGSGSKKDSDRSEKTSSSSSNGTSGGSGDSVRTGDDSRIIFWLTLMLISLSGLMACEIRRRMKHQHHR